MPGSIHVITGPMGSGKSAWLIDIATNYNFRGTVIKAFKPAVDTRSTGIIESRNGRSIPAYVIYDQIEMYSLGALSAEHILIDEAQFFDDDLVGMVHKFAKYGAHVWIAGLDQDFLGRPFGPMGDLLVEADHITKLAATCRCGARATMTQRLVDGEPAKRTDPLVLIGGDESYEPRCRSCHVIG